MIIADNEILSLIHQPATKENGFKLLMNNYQEKLYWHNRRFLQNHEDANDVLQNTFIKIWNNIDKFRAESSLFTWCFKIASNECITFLNSNKKRQYVDLDNTNIESKTTNDLPDAEKLEQKLNEALASLPEKQKQVFVLRYYDELPYDEMSRILETSVGALKASYHIAAKKVEEYILSH